MGRDLFRKPFDDGTVDKLQIFEDYFKEWLPVFIVRKEILWNEIQIFDLFAGEGMDVNGVLGSPIRILKVLNEFNDLFKRNRIFNSIRQFYHCCCTCCFGCFFCNFFNTAIN